MMKHEIEALILYSETANHKRKCLKAMDIIRQALKKAPSSQWYVSFSGGKDSTVVYDLVSACISDIDSIWIDDEFYLPETKSYIQRMKKAGAKIKQVSKRVKHTDWFIANEEKGDDKEIYSSYKGVFLGLRAQESSDRRRYFKRFGLLHFSEKGKVFQGWRCNPIAWWSIKDVWAYIFSRKIDYNKAYDRMSEMGVLLERQRIGPYAVESALGYGQLAILKKCWPEEFRRFLNKYPQAGNYI